MKKLTNLKGVKTLSKTHQKTISGGMMHTCAAPEIPCSCIPLPANCY